MTERKKTGAQVEGEGHIKFCYIIDNEMSQLPRLKCYEVKNVDFTWKNFTNIYTHTNLIIMYTSMCLIGFLCSVIWCKYDREWPAKSKCCCKNRSYTSRIIHSSSTLQNKSFTGIELFWIWTLIPWCLCVLTNSCCAPHPPLVGNSLQFILPRVYYWTYLDSIPTLWFSGS
jgi:hypothetical protein